VVVLLWHAGVLHRTSMGMDGVHLATVDDRQVTRNQALLFPAQSSPSLPFSGATTFLSHMPSLWQVLSLHWLSKT
jgi:hypothetical protein